jgi:hypothetical protein
MNWILGAAITAGGVVTLLFTIACIKLAIMWADFTTRRWPGWRGDALSWAPVILVLWVLVSVYIGFNA